MLSTDVKATLEAEAGDWLARLDRNDVTPQVRAQFERWRAGDPRRAAAYARLEATWQQLDRIQAMRPADRAVDDPDYLLRPPAVGAESQQTPSRHRYQYLALAASVLLAIAAVLVATQYRGGALYTTGVGGFQRIVLSDASVVELNTATRVRVAFDKGLRKIELLQGEANFKVARDPRRPFVVTAGETAVRAVGTSFNVRRSKDHVEVIVTEGRVAVGDASAVERATSSLLPPSAPILNAGQSAIAGAQGLKLREVPEAVAGRRLAWQGGMLAFQGDALRDVVAEFNRYNDKQLIVDDPAAAEYKVGGYFRPTNLDAFVEVLKTKLALRVSVSDDRIVLATKNSTTD